MKLTIIGASGHGKVVAGIAELCGYDKIDFLDDNESLTRCSKWPVRGKLSLARETDHDLFVAIGHAATRKRIVESLPGKHFATLIHPSAVIGIGVTLGEGTVVMPGAVINSDAALGAHCIVNTCASIDHDCRIGNYVHVAVGAHVCGMVLLDDRIWVGAGATVINNLSICSDCMIGAGAAVVKTISVPGTYVGVPAQIHDKRKSL
ncbi:MAG: acetyltransferase [Clostridia bacterium]|nr:acetyltransferase [Clostridia bacterium]